MVAALAALAALGAAPAGAATDGPSAGPATEHVVATSRTFALGGFQTLLPKVDVPAPRRAGYVTRMTAELQYEDGRRVPIQRVMLHHLVFLASGQGAGRTSCDGRAGEPFYGTGEEHQDLVLPDGYGYRVAPHMRWRMQAMLMSHSEEGQQVRVVYRYTIVTGRALTPVKPLWLRANGCTPNPSYDITGGGAPGSVHVKTHDWTLPLSGRIVAVGSHLHGSAFGMKIQEPGCGNRTIVRNRARYGNAGDRVYRLRPTLHEPGPISTGYWMSAQGLPVAKGQVLRVTAAYDAQYPHPQVMAIDHVYIAPDERAAKTPCAPLPADRHLRWERHDGTFRFPRVIVPLTRLTETGALVPVDRPPGPQTVLTARRATIPLKDAEFANPNVSIAAGTTLTWKWLDRGVDHNVLLASGPRNVSSPTRGYGATFKRRFDTPGTYRLFCYLHPVTMQEVVTVRTAAGTVPFDEYAGADGRPIWPAERPDPPVSRAASPDVP
jgi:plastocyanin